MDMCMVEMQYLGLSWQFFSHFSFRTYCRFQDAVLAQPVPGFAKHVLESFGLFMIVQDHFLKRFNVRAFLFAEAIYGLLKVHGRPRVRAGCN